MLRGSGAERLVAWLSVDSTGTCSVVFSSTNIIPAGVLQCNASEAEMLLSGFDCVVWLVLMIQASFQLDIGKNYTAATQHKL